MLPIYQTTIKKIAIMLIYCKYILTPTLFTLPNAIPFVFLYNRPEIFI